MKITKMVKKILEKTRLVIVRGIQGSQSDVFPFRFNVADNKSTVYVRICPENLERKIVVKKDGDSSLCA